MTNMMWFSTGIFCGSIAQAAVNEYLEYRRNAKHAKDIYWCETCDKRSRYAWWTYIVVAVCSRIPFVGRYLVGFAASFWFTQILKEGEAYGRTRKTQVS